MQGDGESQARMMNTETEVEFWQRAVSEYGVAMIDPGGARAELIGILSEVELGARESPYHGGAGDSMSQGGSRL